MFEFVPQLVITMPSYGITDSSYGYVASYYFLCAIRGVESDYSSSNKFSRYYTWASNKLSWYSTRGDVGQCNIANTTYYWIGF